MAVIRIFPNDNFGIMRTNLFLTAALSLSLFTASTAQTLPAYLPTDGLVGWWPFNGNANDESGNGNNGTVNGATLVVDRFGNESKAYNFNGTNSDIVIPFYTSQLLQQYSISLWFNIDVYTSNYPQILWGYNNQGSLNGYSFNVQLNTAIQLLEFYMEVQPNVTGPLLNSTPNLISTDFNYHLLINKTETSTNLYLNNILINSTDEINPTILSDSIYVGNNGSYLGYKGVVDDIAIYNRALTPEEITALYTGEPVNPPTACNPLPSNLQNGLVGYWPFCGNANDERGNGNDGTVNGATLTEDRFGVATSAINTTNYGSFVKTESVINNTDNSFTIALWANPSENDLIKTQGVSGDEGTGLMSIIHPPHGLNWGDMSTNAGVGVNVGKNQIQIVEHTHLYIASPLVYSTQLDGWNSVILVYDQHIPKLYLNGSLVAIGLQSPIESLHPGSGYCSIYQESGFGTSFNPNGNPIGNYKGDFDDIGIWNRALSPEEVQQLYTLNACTFTIYDTVTVTQTVYDTVTTYTTVTDTLIINTLITELAPPANTNTIKVFPNPAGSTLTIDYGNFALMNGYQLRIENSLGQEVFQTNISQQSETLSLGTWGGNGLYFVHIVDPQGNTVDIRKIVLQ
jgi:hypothetical protein